jgi:hypothetical protein
MKHAPCSSDLIRVNAPAPLINELPMRVMEATCESYKISFVPERERERGEIWQQMRI